MKKENGEAERRDRESRTCDSDRRPEPVFLSFFLIQKHGFKFASSYGEREHPGGSSERQTDASNRRRQDQVGHFKQC